MTFKNYLLEKKGESNGFHYSFYKYSSLNPFIYFIALKTTPKQIHIIEVFFPNEEIMKENEQEILDSLKKLKINE
jgi:hypothetical protein